MNYIKRYLGLCLLCSMTVMTACSRNEEIKVDATEEIGVEEEASNDAEILNTDANSEEEAESESNEGKVAEVEESELPQNSNLQVLDAKTDLYDIKAGSTYGSVNGDAKSMFRIYEIAPNDAVYQRIIGKSYVENPNISLSDLRYIKLLHYNYNHEIQVGELITNKDLASDMINVFSQLYDQQYEIYSMYLIDEFWAGNGDDTDTASCDANNTSCFCYRAQTNSTKLSNHALGRAIDINPVENPYVLYKNGKAIWYHENSNGYIDRSVIKPHMITTSDASYIAFRNAGYTWGGAWNSVKDYQHFEK